MTIPKDRLESMRRSAMMSDLVPSEYMLQLLDEIDALTKELFIVKTENAVEIGRSNLILGVQDIAVERDRLREQNKIMIDALEFYANSKNEKMVEVNGKKHFILEYGCGCCSFSYDVDEDGTIGALNAELDNVQGWTARAALAEIKNG